MSALPRLLLLGDSIRMSYQPHVVRLLDGQVNVVGPKVNGEFSAHTLASLDEWLEECGRPDVVHWNNGLHDIGHRPEREPRQIPIQTYEDNLVQILGRLREVTSKIVWATTTPVHPTRPFLDTEWAWRNEEVIAYNDVATALMTRENVPINNLYEVVRENEETCFVEDKLHLNGTGQSLCAVAVVKSVTLML